MPYSMKALADVFSFLKDCGYTEVIDMDIGAKGMYIEVKKVKGSTPIWLNVAEVIKEIDSVKSF